MALERRLYLSKEGVALEIQLKNKFFRSLIVSTSLFTLSIFVFLIVLLISWATFPGFLSIIFTAFLGLYILYAAKKLVPFLKDWDSIKNKHYELAEGIVVGYKKHIHGGEPPTTSYTPIIQDEISNRQIELDVDGTVLNGRYRFLYLKNTTLAVFEKL